MDKNFHDSRWSQSMCLNCVIFEKMFVDVFGGRNAELCLINLIFMARSPPQKNSVNTKWRTLLLCVFALTYRLQSVSTLKVFCTTRDLLKLFNPRSAGSKELLNNFKILTGQGLCESLSCSWAYAKPKNRLIVIVNPASIFF